jgi:hypothetical protein
MQILIIKDNAHWLTFACTEAKGQREQSSMYVHNESLWLRSADRRFLSKLQCAH